jgi:hypothetical protein
MGEYIWIQENPQTSPSTNLPEKQGRNGTSNNSVSVPPNAPASKHKRCRRGYKEIERMFKCEWNGCEKAYGELHHLNTHIMMESHGQKRTRKGDGTCLASRRALAFYTGPAYAPGRSSVQPTM